MKIRIIGSSSSGNSTYIFNNDTHILVDAGLSAKKTIEIAGRKSFDALFISHEHSDHIKGMKPLMKKTDLSRIYINSRIVEQKFPELKDDPRIQDLIEGTTISVGSMEITPFSTKHDSIYSLGFVISDENTKLGILTDTGSISKVIENALRDCDSLIIETDYDEKLLREYEHYDQLLKERITSNFGHLSNRQVVEYLQSVDLDAKKSIILGHLSPRTNRPEVLEGHLKTAFDNRKFIIASEGLEVEV